LGVGERYYFSLQENSRTADPFPGTNFSQLWRELFFGEKLKVDVTQHDQDVTQHDQGWALLRGMVIAGIDEVKNSDASTDINDSIEDVNDFLVTASAAAAVNFLDISSTEIADREIKIWKTRTIPFPKDKNPQNRGGKIIFEEKKTLFLEVCLRQGWVPNVCPHPCWITRTVRFTLCLLCVTPLVCPSYSSFALSSPFFSS